MNFSLATVFLSFYRTVILDYPKSVVSLVAVFCSLSLYYSAENLGFNTDTAGMLSSELPFHQNRIQFWNTFPQDVRTILVVVDAATPETSKIAAERLQERLNQEKNVVKSVYIPGQEPFFDEQALLYLDIESLVGILNILATSQPLLGQLAENNSLERFLALIGRSITNSTTQFGFELKPLLRKIEEAFGDAEAGDYNEVSWQSLLTGGNPDLTRTRRFVIVKAALDYSRIFPASQTIQRIKNHTQAIESEMENVTFHMTGEIALQHEELESVSQGSLISAFISLVLVGVTLFAGLRSFRLILAALLTLVAGLAMTAGFATLTVGHLNMISIAFAVLYIGLGVDYAIHFCLHYQSHSNHGKSVTEALIAGARSVAPAIALCAITSATGFYSFIPTAYSGVSELGVISGTSMFIALVLTLTFLPALLRLMKAVPTQRTENSVKQLKPAEPDATFRRRNQIIRWSALALALASIFALPYITFDFDPMHLRNPQTESVTTYNDLVQDPNASPLTLAVLESNQEQMLTVADQIRKLATVDKVLTIDSFIPKNLEPKLEIIEDMNDVLGPMPRPFPGLYDNDRQKKAYIEFQEAVKKAITIHRGSDLEPELVSLRDRFNHFNNAEKPRGSEMQVLKLFEKNLLSSLPVTIDLLQKALKAKAFHSGHLPLELKERWVGPEGIYRMQVYPKKDITQLENLRAFVEDVQSVAPHATDLPVIYYEAGKEVVKAFQQALITALAAITAVLLVVLKSIRQTSLVLMPLILAALMTCAATVLIGLPFNFANIIAVPLLLGLGVDSGIHVMHSFRKNLYSKNFSLMRNITSRGIFFSSLTTVFSFSSLAFSSHTGTASMGILLAIGIFFTLFCTLVVMPAFMQAEK